MTKDKFNDLKNKLEKLKKIQPQAAAEVSRLAELGDFSENTEYQMAKGRLRGINDSIRRLEHQLYNAQIIETQKQNNKIEIGHTVTIEINGKEKKYLILGSSETNPQKGIISHISPLGQALIGHRVGEKIKIHLENKIAEYKIIKIE